MLYIKPVSARTAYLDDVGQWQTQRYVGCVHHRHKLTASFCPCGNCCNRTRFFRLKMHRKAFGDCVGSARPRTTMEVGAYAAWKAGPILSVFPALIVHSELKSVHPRFPVAFIFKAQVN